MSILTASRTGRFLCLCLILASNISFARTDSAASRRIYYGISGGLGVTMINAADVVDYINSAYPSPEKLDDFTASPEFFIAANLQLSESYMIKLEYAYLLRSYNVLNANFPELTFFYSVHMPTVVLHYLYKGEGYLAKAGAGIGYHTARFSQKVQSLTSEFKTHGVGLKIEVEGDTAFDENFFGYIGMEFRGDFMGELKDGSGKPLKIPAADKNAGLSFISIGLKFGLAYYF